MATSSNGTNNKLEEQQSSSKSSDSGTGVDFQINLNEFLEFLKLSCHVNDMIAKAGLDTANTTRELVPPVEGAIPSKRITKKDSAFDFHNLAENPLVNELLGLKQQQQQQQQQHRHKSSGSRDDSDGGKPSRGSHIHGGNTTTTTTTNYRGLHPKLNEQLDYVIDEGILDSVLSFICPVPVPPPHVAPVRTNKPKKTEHVLLQPPNVMATTTSKSTTDLQYHQGSGANANLQGSTTSVPGIGTSGASGTAFGCDAHEANTVVRAMVKEQSSKSSHSSQIRRKSLLLAKDSKHSRSDKKEAEVVIHVCDEVKHTSRDFTCPQSLLVSKMGYFADVTAGQRLDEMDISVHCDVQIFDWLMKWIKHSAHNGDLPGSVVPAGPQLDGNNVIPILVSASFLQMEPLLLECLGFCHAHLSEVVRTSTNLSCLNDALVTRLAAMFTNLELEMVRDKKERVTPRLWTKLIQSLGEPDAEALRGHFYSMSGLFRCMRCFQCVTNTMKSYVNCIPANIRLNRWGQLISHHVRDSNWDLNVYIMQLFKDLKSWRKVYWKLWGHCHYLYCCICEAHFPVYQMNWCRYHPDAPNFLGPVSEGRIAGPAGRYPCCSQQAFRYESLPGPNGCQFREHSVLVETDRERAILAIAQLVSENYALCEQPALRVQEMAAAGEINPSWMGISLTPQRCRQGLLPQLCMDMTNHRVSRRMRAAHCSRYQVDTSSESETTSTSDDDDRCLRKRIRNAPRNNNNNDDFSSSSDDCESEHRHPPKKSKKNSRKRPAEISGRFWSGELSARSNQDHQRDFEEKIMKQVVTYVTKKTGSDQCLIQNAQPLGGSYVRLESEWKEMLKQRHNNNNNNHHQSMSSAAMGSNNGNGGNGLSGASTGGNLGGSNTPGGGGGGAAMSSMSKQKHK